MTAFLYQRSLITSRDRMHAAGRGGGQTILSVQSCLSGLSSSYVVADALARGRWKDRQDCLSSTCFQRLQIAELRSPRHSATSRPFRRRILLPGEIQNGP